MSVLPPNIVTRLKNSCISCDLPSPFSYNSAVGDSASSGKSSLGLTSSSSSDINATSITTVNLTSTNMVTQVISGGIAQFYTLEVVELKGFKLTGSTDSSPDKDLDQEPSQSRSALFRCWRSSL